MRLKPSDVAWLTLAAGVVVYESQAAEGELLSNAVDRYLLRHPWLVRFVIFATAAHLANAIPDRWDIYHRVAWEAVWTSRLSRRKSTRPACTPGLVPAH